MHPLLLCPLRVSQAVRDLIEKQERGRDAGRERVSGKLLIKYESIVCHLSGHASGSPLKGSGGNVAGRRGRGRREIDKAD